MSRRDYKKEYGVSLTFLEALIKTMIKTSAVWREHLLLVVYWNLSRKEREKAMSCGHDKKGGDRRDTAWIVHIGKQLIRKKPLTEGQHEVLICRLPKYWKQGLKKSEAEEELKAALKRHVVRYYGLAPGAQVPINPSPAIK